MNEKALLERLDTHNKLMRQLIEAMPKPAGRITRILEKVALVSGALGIVIAADIIVKWIIGG